MKEKNQQTMKLEEKSQMTEEDPIKFTPEEAREFFLTIFCISTRR
ncbi:MAG: hypothetical protein PHI66_03530 [Candidatus Pacebacteria bacterium]|nr:hypothetical protein [Candidatus Paceibacterota bacterium]